MDARHNLAELAGDPLGVSATPPMTLREAATTFLATSGYARETVRSYGRALSRLRAAVDEETPVAALTARAVVGALNTSDRAPQRVEVNAIRAFSRWCRRHGLTSVDLVSELGENEGPTPP